MNGTRWLTMDGPVKTEHVKGNIIRTYNGNEQVNSSNSRLKACKTTFTIDDRTHQQIIMDTLNISREISYAHKMVTNK